VVGQGLDKLDRRRLSKASISSINEGRGTGASVIPANAGISSAEQVSAEQARVVKIPDQVRGD
jgi:hypothetical protein